MRLPGLDLLRALAIVWVMLFHSFVVDGLGDSNAWLSRFGWMGVDLFFVLSGFLIGSQVLAPSARGEPLSLRDFYVRRAFRILPAFVVVLALYLALPGFREAPGMEPWWKFATFTLNMDIDYANHAAFSHAWSLCVEEQFYLLFPGLAWLMLQRPSARRLGVVCVGIVLSGIALRSTAWLHDSALDPPRNWFVEDIYYPTWNRLDGLLAGVMLATAKIFRPRLWARAARHANAALLLGLALLAVAFWLFRDRVGLLGNALGWPVLSLSLMLVVFAGACGESWIGRRAIRGAGWLAGISYSLYLVHKPIFHLAHDAFGARLGGPSLPAFIVYALLAVAAGALLHYLVERPCLALRQRALAAMRPSLQLAPVN